MRRLILILLAFWLHRIGANAQSSGCEGCITTIAYRDSTEELYMQVEGMPDDTGKINSLIYLGNYLTHKRNAGKPQLDSSIFVFDRGIQLAKALRSSKWENECIKAIANNMVYVGHDTTEAFVRYRQVVQNEQAGNDPAGKAAALEDFGKALFDYALDLSRALHCYQEARQLHQQSNNVSGVYRMLKYIGLVNKEEGRLELAAQQLTVVDSFFRTTGDLREQSSCKYELAYIYWRMANTQQALFYNQEALKLAERLRDYTWMSNVMNQLGRQFYNLQLYAEALTYFERSLEYANRGKSQSDYVTALGTVISDRVLLGKTRDLLEYLQSADRSRPSANQEDLAILYKAYGEAYSAIGQPTQAERYFIQAVALFNKAYEQNAYGNNGRLWLQAYYSALGDFYLGQHRFDKARKSFGRILSLPPTVLTPATRSDVRLKLYKIDSASGNYLSAIRHLLVHDQLHDSIFNATSAKQIADLKERYRADQRSKDITELESRQKSQIIEVQNARLQRDIELGVIATVIAFAGILYVGYRKKQRSNRQLRFQKQQIDDQNVSLAQLLEEKEALLTEKDWLLKEVHHRVKNNLQVITSLLNFQSASALSSDALEAIRISRNRIQAISLIHLKLSAGNSLTTVNIQSYVTDLIQHLHEMFDLPGHYIEFRNRIEAIDIDISQAVPIGLILNEAITNSIKHAFGADGGEIVLSLQLIGQQTICLRITDNGKGFTDDIDPKLTDSLGFKIMRGLSSQLKGKFSVDHTGRTEICIQFPLKGPQKIRRLRSATDQSTSIF